MKLLKLVVAFCMVVSLAACNTVQGVGKDIQKGGEKIENAAKR